MMQLTEAPSAVTGRLAVQVARRTTEAPDIVSLELRAIDGSALPAFSAGAHIDVHLGPGLVRQYSLCNDPAERDRYEIAVLREPASRGGSAAVHDRLQAGAVLEIGVPRNLFALQAQAPALLLAGGIGITPLLAMAHELARRCTPFQLHYCTRSIARAAFAARLREAPFAPQVHFHFDDGAPSQRLALPTLLAEAAAGTVAYVCGPGGFIEFVRQAARDAGWPDERVRFEYFNAPAAPAGATVEPDGPFEVCLRSSGQVIAVAAKEPVTEALARHGVLVPVACLQGICGTCVTGVLEGTPDHRDMYFTDQEKAEGRQFTPCCSRSRTPRLVLDL